MARESSSEVDGQRMPVDLKDRLAKFGLSLWLHPLLRVDARWQVDVGGGVKPVHDRGEDRRRLR